MTGRERPTIAPRMRDPLLSPAQAPKRKVVVIGAGAMGLAAAYHAARAGANVELIEAAPLIGGMAAHLDLDGISIERFYHFVCKADRPTFELMSDLGIGDQMRWRTTTMGFFIGGRLHKWGDPFALLRFPEVGLVARLRYGFLAFVSTRRERWDVLERQSAREWIIRWAGREAYEKLWRPLFELKFFDYADNISAAWIWTRVKRLGRSRRSLFEEELGYIEGGSQTLVDQLELRIGELGGRIRTGSPVDEVLVSEGKVTGVRLGDELIQADRVISTVPTPLVAKMVPALPDLLKQRYSAIENIGVVCLLFRLKRSVTPNFWVNIAQDGFEIPGIVEFSNLRAVGDTTVFVPYYMPVTHPKFAWDDARLIEEAFGYLRRINPALQAGDIVATRVGRLRHAQPICPPGFAAMLPPIQTPIDGLQIADTCFYYPEDRGISESVRLGREMAAAAVSVPTAPSAVLPKLLLRAAT